MSSRSTGFVRCLGGAPRHRCALFPGSQWSLNCSRVYQGYKHYQISRFRTFRVTCQLNEADSPILDEGAARPKFLPFNRQSPAQERVVGFQRVISCGDNVLVIQPMPEELLLEATDVLTDSFADSMGYLSVYKNFLRMQIKQYLQRRVHLPPKTVILVALLMTQQEWQATQQSADAQGADNSRGVAALAPGGTGSTAGGAAAPVSDSDPAGSVGTSADCMHPPPPSGSSGVSSSSDCGSRGTLDSLEGDSSGGGGGSSGSRARDGGGEGGTLEERAEGEAGQVPGASAEGSGLQQQAGQQQQEQRWHGGEKQEREEEQGQLRGMVAGMGRSEDLQRQQPLGMQQQGGAGGRQGSTPPLVRSRRPAPKFVGLGSLDDVPSRKSSPMDLPSSVDQSDEGMRATARSSQQGPPPAQLPGEVVGVVEVSFAESVRTKYITLNEPKDRPYICNVAVAPEFRGQGHGKRIMSAAEELVAMMGENEIYLHVRFQDEVACKLYSGTGYEIVKEDSPFVVLLRLDRRRLLRKRLP